MAMVQEALRRGCDQGKEVCFVTFDIPMGEWIEFTEHPSQYTCKTLEGTGKEIRFEKGAGTIWR